jgi:hypothetical protein
MSALEWSAFFAALAATIGTVLAGLRWLVKGWLWTLTPNSGSSLADRLARIETRQDEMMRILQER